VPASTQRDYFGPWTTIASITRMQHCSRCHGTNMITPGNVAYDLRQFPHDAKARFVQSVMQGKNGRMPPWGDLLSPGDVDELWAYVKAGGKQ
jgi:mono/diheme cytochrome c family protein